MSQKKIGIALSYINSIIGLVANIYLTPLLILTLGDENYSLYRVMHSLAGPLTMFHLGISTIVTRSIVKCRQNGNESLKEKQNTMAMALLSSIGMSVVVTVAGLGLYIAIPSIYGNSYSEEMVRLGQKIFLMFGAASVLHMLTDTFSGCIIGNEHYAVDSWITLAKSAGRLLLIAIMLKCGCGVFSVVAVDLYLAAGAFLVSLLYAVFMLREIPKLWHFDKRQVGEIFAFGMAVLLQGIVTQVNNNMDTVILGALVFDKAVITMYSAAISVYGFYNAHISVSSHFFLPQAAKLTGRNASGGELTDFVIPPGRFQAVITVACICGFALFGREFISLWIGDEYMDAYGVILALMIPATIPLVEKTLVSVLDATMKRMYRSVVLGIMAVVNLVTSVLLVQRFGFWGAVAGTALSLLLGDGLLMNHYYAKVFRIEVFRMFRQIFAGILPAGLLASLICLPGAVFLSDSIWWFALKCFAFVTFYGGFLLAFGLRKEEKQMLHGMLRKLHSK